MNYLSDQVEQFFLEKNKSDLIPVVAGSKRSLRNMMHNVFIFTYELFDIT